jgi:GGDEF domain-containing protein
VAKTATLPASASPAFPTTKPRRPEGLFRAADEALYAAKRAGKNQVMGAGPAEKVD